MAEREMKVNGAIQLSDEELSEVSGGFHALDGRGGRLATTKMRCPGCGYTTTRVGTPTVPVACPRCGAVLEAIA